MSPFWVILLVILGAIGAFVYYILSQMGGNERLDPTAPTIVPGSIQVSNPDKKPPKAQKIPDQPPAKTPVEAVSPETLKVKPIKKKPGSRRVRFFQNKSDVIRSFVIDLILDRKTK
jgi:hypothetical protein